MATSFPTGLDTFVDPVGTNPLTAPDHAGQHTNINDAVAALEAKVGVNSSAVTTSLDYIVNHLPASGDVPALTSATTPRSGTSTLATLVSGVPFYFPFTATSSYTSSQVTFYIGTTTTTVYAGLYSMDASENLTRIAVTASFGTTANTLYTKSWTAGVALTAGTRYAVAFLAVGGVSSILSSVTGQTAVDLLHPFVAASSAGGQTTLPTGPIAYSSLTGATNVGWAWVQ